MKTVWSENGEARSNTSPVSLVVSAFAPVIDIEQSLTPALRRDIPNTVLVYVDLGGGRHRLGGAALAQVYGSMGSEAPDIDDPAALAAFFSAVQLLNDGGYLLAYHDRSDGGLIASVVEMSLAGRAGVTLTLPAGSAPLATLFSEEAGAVLQVRRADLPVVLETLQRDPGAVAHPLGDVVPEHCVTVRAADGAELLNTPLDALQADWSSTSFHMAALRDNPDDARQEFESLKDLDDPGLGLHVPFETDHWRTGAAPAVGHRPRVAVLREQGVNGHVEMAAAFDAAGFEAVDVHMTDLVAGRADLADFAGLAACGGFSFGDVLGAGSGWARSILFNPLLREAFATFFAREDRFALGVCNGCQMLAQLAELIPGAAHWPRFVANRSGQFEARLIMTEVVESPSLLLAGMAGARLPTVIAHGEGRVEWAPGSDASQAPACLRYVDNHGRPTERYPANPNGSPGGITGLTSESGRVTIMMPHPERAFLARQHSWLPPDWRLYEGPWLRMFENARAWTRL
ncbi:MAG: phosphoribosylformylglycinamidine synthase, partial [Gammaproteobacteria bacterium]|nr:phosphoribosylformylglycinamidine synthase [Gammaproteobacteria bacterium]